MNPYLFIKAANFTVAHRERVDLIVIHSTEGKNLVGSARRTATYFANQSTALGAHPQASSHFVVDAEEVVQCVHDTDVAWHAPGANRRGIGIELCGRAAQTAAEWTSGRSLLTLQLAADLVARLCRAWAIPVIKVGPQDLLRGARGLIGHVDATMAWHKSTHTDPGVGFPWGRFLSLVRASAVQT